MVRALTGVFVKLVRRWLPQPFTFAIVLSIITFLGGMFVMGKTAAQMTGFWGKGIFSLYGFTMQMVLVLITGSALANSPVVKKI
ncbi:MAG: TIGR00366 family protein [Synergistaceae bacterium]|jgi:short-chain fatty acids transporter|nr:TIGR00366 family protein [Synergistaceae bacterium]